MNVRAFLRTTSLFFLAAGVTGTLFVRPAAAQDNDYFDDNGHIVTPDPFPDDGFRPVWMQEQQKAKEKAARAAKQAAAKRAAEAKAKAQQAALQPPVPLHTDTQTYDHWTLTCQDFAGKPPKKICAAALKVTEAQSGNLVVVWDIRRGPDGKFRSVIQTPTGIQVPTGVEVTLGEGNVRKFAYESCSQQNCEAVGPIDDALIKQIQTAPEAAFTVRAKDGRSVTFKSPVGGIDKAIAGVRS